MLRIIIVVVTLTAILFTGCIPQVTGDEIKSDKSRITSPQVNPDNMAALATGNTEFAVDLYQYLKDTEGNIFYSPFSISMALAMVYAGARNDTETEIANTIHFNLPQSSLHPAFNKLDMELNSRGKAADSSQQPDSDNSSGLSDPAANELWNKLKAQDSGTGGKDDKGFRLNIVNAIWGQKGYNFLPAFLDVLAENYGAGLRVLNFKTEPEPSRKIINDWVSDQTEQRIKDLVPQSAITPATRLVLTNAIYFNAAWLDRFQKDATHKSAFFLLDGNEISVDMMSQTEYMDYADGDGYQAVELPYDGNKLSMVLIVPDKGQFQQFEDGFNVPRLTGILGSLNGRQVALIMPKFEFDSSFNLNSTLMQMGMPTAFSTFADFSGMTGNRELAISDVIHKAFVSVDENGTEAAAATAVIIRVTSMPPGNEPVSLTIDRPFIFLIRDIPTNTVLFMGRVLDPS
jgi:serpin B